MRAPTITISIVSHGHGPAVRYLVAQLNELHAGCVAHVVVTHNLPCATLFPVPDHLPFRLTERVNKTPLGFGANHNNAFGHCETDYFCVVNPDIILETDALWPSLVVPFKDSEVGCVYPVSLAPDGSLQDSERELVTPSALLRRHLAGMPPRRVDWVSAAFLLVSSKAWRSIGGFDERYHMYCEDVDFCMRLQLAGWTLVRAPIRVVHVGARQSRRKYQHLFWHISSLLRLWMSPAFYRYRRQFSRGNAG